MYVKFMANQLVKPAVVDRLTNQLLRVVKTLEQEEKKKGYYLKTVAPPFDTFMKANTLKALWAIKIKGIINLLCLCDAEHPLTANRTAAKGRPFLVQ